VRFRLISVGRKRSDPTATLVTDYAGRIAKFIPCELVVLRPDRPDRIAAQMLRESGRATLLVAFDERGRELDTKAFTELVSSWLNRGLKQVALVIGGAEGLPPQVAEKADLKVALSRMTLPHRLARLVAVEQLYRALCTIRNVPYQK
jgi:23S rRNA (pseudouridine1915-N3)-methyltransferase